MSQLIKKTITETETKTTVTETVETVTGTCDETIKEPNIKPLSDTPRVDPK